MSRWGWIGAAALLIASNGVLAGLGVLNRAGEPEAAIRVTERELSLGDSTEGFSTRILRLRWAQRGDWLRDGPGWFDRAKLEALGFHCAVPPTAPAAPSHYAKVLPRKAYVVLEYEGDSWQEWLAQKSMEINALAARVEKGEMAPAEYRGVQEAFARNRRGRSRLFAVDAGRDAGDLRGRYPDRNRFVIAEGIVRLTLKAGSAGPYLGGEILEVPGDEVPVPMSGRKTLEALFGRPRTNPDPLWSEPREPRYGVGLRWGRLHRPWIEGIERL